MVQVTVLDGLTTREAARLLGIPTGTVTTRVMRPVPFFERSWCDGWVGAHLRWAGLLAIAALVLLVSTRDPASRVMRYQHDSATTSPKYSRSR